MVEKYAEAKKFEIPTALRGALERLPSAEALSVVDDIGKLAWIVDHNNNNNNAKKALEELQNLSKDELIKIITEQQRIV